MKKKLLVTLILFILNSNAYCQNSINIYGGINHSFPNIEFDYVKDFPSKNFFIIGTNFEHKFNHLALNLGLEYDKHGTDIKSGTLLDKAVVSQLNLPISIKYYLNSFYISGGLYAGYIVSSKIDDNPINEIEYFKGKKIDFGLNASLGYNYKNFGLGVKYIYGLINIYSYDSYRFFNDHPLNDKRDINISYKNQSILLYLEYKINMY